MWLGRDRLIVWPWESSGIQETGVWLPIDRFKLAITVVSGFCQGIAENQWDASGRLVNQFSALPVRWPFPVGCLSVCHLNYLAFFVVVFPWHHLQATCALPRGTSMAATYPKWHLSRVAKLTLEWDIKWWIVWHMASGRVMLQDSQGQRY